MIAQGVSSGGASWKGGTVEEESDMHTCTVDPVRSVWHARLYCAVTVAGVDVEKNAVSFLHEASGGSSSFLLAFLMPLLLALLLISVVPGLRPAPGRRPPLQPFVPTMLIGHPTRGTMRGTMRIPKRADPQMTCTMNHFGCTMTAFENGA